MAHNMGVKWWSFRYFIIFFGENLRKDSSNKKNIRSFATVFMKES